MDVCYNSERIFAFQTNDCTVRGIRKGHALMLWNIQYVGWGIWQAARCFTV